MEESQGRTLDSSTSQGRQRAFLQGKLDHPRNLWIVCGGNGTVALDWSDWLRENAPAEDAFLLFDMPGYGDCDGKPNPHTIRESLRKAVPTAWGDLGFTGDPAPSRLRFFGHSLGAAVSLIAADEFGIQRGVLLAPFTSTMDMASEVTGLPLGFLVTHRFDNMARLDRIEQRGPGRVVVLHGSADEVIPMAMGKNLATSHPGICRFVKVPNGRHNDIPAVHPEPLANAFRETNR